MNLKTKYLIEKIGSCLCLAIAVMLLFSGWITIRSGEYRREIRREIKNFGSEFEEVEKDDIEEAQEELDDMGIDINVNSIYKSVNKLYKSVKDVALSPKEIIGILPVVNKLSKMMEELEDSPMGGFGMMSGDMEEIVDRGAAGIDTNLAFVDGLEFFLLAGHAVINPHRFIPPYRLLYCWRTVRPYIH